MEVQDKVSRVREEDMSILSRLSITIRTPWIFHLSLGGLQAPTDSFLRVVHSFEKKFGKFHGAGINKGCQNPLNDFRRFWQSFIQIGLTKSSDSTQRFERS